MEKTEFDAEKIWKVIEGSRQHAAKKKLSSSRPNLMALLNNSLVEWTEKCSDKCARRSGGLLEGLVSSGVQVSLVVCLYGDDEGYSIMLPQSREVGEQREVALPYEDMELLNYIEANEIPPVMLELLATSPSTHFYSGCVVAEVRNFRGFFTSPNHCERSYLLLQPTHETLLSMVEQARRKHQLTYEQVLAVEGHLLRVTSPQLCLDPTSDVLCVANRLQYSRNKFRTYSMRRYLRKLLPGHRRSRHAFSSLSVPGKLRLHNFVSRLDQKRVSPLGVGVSTVSGSGTTVRDLHSVKLTVPESLDQFLGEFAKHLAVNYASPESPLPAIQRPVTFATTPNYPKVATPSPVAIVAPTEAPAVPTHPVPSGIPAQLPSSTAPPPPAVAQPSPHPPATPIHPTLRFSNEVMMNLLSNRAALMNMLQPYQQPSTSWANLTMAPPTPSTPPTVPGSLQSHQPPPKPTPSTQPIGMPILPASVVLQRTGRVTARVVGPAPAPSPVPARPSRPPHIVRPTEAVPKMAQALTKAEFGGRGQGLPTLRSQTPPVLRPAPPLLRSNSPTPSLQQQNTTPHHPKHYPASIAPVPPPLHMAAQKLTKLVQPVSLTPPRLQGPTLTTPTLGDTQQQPPKDRLPQSSVPPMIVRPSLLSGVPPTHIPLTSPAPPQLSRAMRLPTAPPPLRGAPQVDTHMPPKTSAPPPLQGVPRTDTRTPPVASAPPPLRGVSGADTYKLAPPLLRGTPRTDPHTSAPPPLRGVPRTDIRTPPVASAPPPLRGSAPTDKYRPPMLLHPERRKGAHGKQQ